MRTGRPKATELIPFYAVKEDLLPVLEALESNGSVKYVRKGGQLTAPSLTVVDHGKDIPGEWCCADADGWRPDENDLSWDMDTNKYRVKDHSTWLEVRDYADLSKMGIPNRVDRAVVWIRYEEITRIVCFLPGPEL